MSEQDLQALHNQLQRLRGQLPEFLQKLSSVDGSQSSQTAFYEAAKALSSWTTETQAFVSQYEKLKPRIEELKTKKPTNAQTTEPETLVDDSPFKNPGMDQYDYGFGGEQDTFGNEYFDLT